MIIDLEIVTRFVENARRSINLWWQARFVGSEKKSDENYLYINRASYEILEVADLMIKEYQSDLDYLKDK